MQKEEKPLFSLTVNEFMAITKRLVNDVLLEKREGSEEELTTEDDTEHFTIKELAAFLRCSIVSIHNYKKMGMPFYRVGRKVLFKKQEVLTFMKSINLKTNKKKQKNENSNI